MGRLRAEKERRHFVRRGVRVFRAGRRGAQHLRGRGRGKMRRRILFFFQDGGIYGHQVRIYRGSVHAGRRRRFVKGYVVSPSIHQDERRFVRGAKGRGGGFHRGGGKADREKSRFLPRKRAYHRGVYGKLRNFLYGW